MIVVGSAFLLRNALTITVGNRWLFCQGGGDYDGLNLSSLDARIIFVGVNNPVGEHLWAARSRGSSISPRHS